MIQIRNLTRNPNGVEEKVTLQDLIMNLQTDVLPIMLRLEVDNSQSDLNQAKTALNFFRRKLNDFETRIKTEVQDEIIFEKSLDNRDKENKLSKIIEEKKNNILL